MYRRYVWAMRFPEEPVGVMGTCSSSLCPLVFLAFPFTWTFSYVLQASRACSSRARKCHFPHCISPQRLAHVCVVHFSHSYLPWIMLTFETLMGKNPIVCLMGASPQLCRVRSCPRLTHLTPQHIYHPPLSLSLYVPLPGIAAGHCYYFLQEVAPEAYGYTVLHTPKFLQNLMDVNPAGPAVNNNPARNAFGGNGNVLGGN